MSFFIVDPDKCKRDGICVSDCPAQIIELKDQRSLPELIPGGAELCINCGHCVAVCPHGAMSLKTMTSEQCPPLDRAILPTQRQMDHFLRSRRSIRVYKDKPVDREILASLIELHDMRHPATIPSRSTGSSYERELKLNRLAGIVIDWMRLMIETKWTFAQDMHFDRVVQAWENGVDRVLRDAPHLIVAHGPSGLPHANGLHHCARPHGTGCPLFRTRRMLGRVILTLPRRTSTSLCNRRFHYRKAISVTAA